MLVITQNTEERLINDLKQCWETQPKHRCLHLKFSQIEDDSYEIHTWPVVIAREFSVLADQEDAQIYVCQDHDIFITARTLTQKRVDQFLAHLAPQLTPALLSPGLASLFEMQVDWPRLRTICEKKIEAIALARALAKQQKQDALDKVTKEEALKALNRDLLSSLAMRREQRQEPQIMVVEDDLFSQKMVGTALKNYTLSMTADGAGALMSYVRNAPDVLFLDICLPDINGHEVLERLFKIDPDAYVVMFSGNGDRENVLKAVELGAKGFVGKPFTKEKLIAYIEKSPFIQAKTKKEHAHECSA